MHFICHCTYTTNAAGLTQVVCYRRANLVVITMTKPVNATEFSPTEGLYVSLTLCWKLYKISGRNSKLAESVWATATNVIESLVRDLQ